MRGIPNAAVFPVPVWDWTIRSRPVVTRGTALAWTRVGVT